jgi:hypothetical protein
MRSNIKVKVIVMLVVAAIVLSVSIFTLVQSAQARDGPPGVGQILVREGTRLYAFVKSRFATTSESMNKV